MSLLLHFRVSQASGDKVWVGGAGQYAHSPGLAGKSLS